MRLVPTLAALVCAAAPLLAATFGTVVAPAGGAAYSDIVLDEARSRLYLVNTALNRIDIYNLKTKAFLTSIGTGLQPVSAALSRDGNSLFVTAYTSTSLDVVNLNTGQLAQTISLPISPEGAAVGADGRVLISGVASGTSTANTLIVYDPTITTGNALVSVPVLPPAGTPPVLPTPSGRVYVSYRSRLVATADGKWIIGVNGPTAATKVVFVFEAASGTVLRSRNVTNLSTTIAVAPDGSRFMAGSTLFNAQTLQVMAQENAANAPFAFPAGTAGNFNLQQNQGGSVFSPDGTVLYGAFNIAPVNAAKPTVTELLVNDPANLLINMGLEMPENLDGKMVIDSAGANVYAISDSGFTILPVSAIAQSPLAVPQSQTLLLTHDTCGVLNGATASDTINNAGKARFTIGVASAASAAVTLPTGFPATTAAGGPPGPPGASVPAPNAQASNSGASPVVTFTYNNAAATSPGTVGPSDFILNSTEAINIPGNIHVFQNDRDSVSTGTILPIPMNASTSAGPSDIVFESTRQRVYIANSGLNRIEVFDIKQNAFLAPIKVGQLPLAMALASDHNTLYVANAGGESISVVNLTSGAETAQVPFPAIPLNAAVPIANPVAIAVSIRGPLFVLSNGTVWDVQSGQAVPRALESTVFGTAATTVSGGTPVFWNLAATPAGEYVLLYTGAGNAYLYNDSVDAFTITKQALTAPLVGYAGPVTAGPLGQYYAIGGTILNASLTPVEGSTNGLSSSGRLVAGVAAVSATQLAEFTEPVRASATAVAADAGMVEIVNPATGASAGGLPTLEGPAVIGTGTTRVGQFARTIAIDTAGATAYVLTATGLSIVALAPGAASATRPSVNNGGAVSLGDYTASLAAGGLVSIFGQNFGATAVGAPPLPTVLSGACVTLNGAPIPLLLMSATQINAQIPLTLAAGRYPLVVRNITNQAISATTNVTVAKYAPAVLIGNGGQPAIIHKDGTFVNADNPANRDETLLIYATGLGPTTGAAVTTGNAAPASPPAATGTVQVYFGNPLFVQGQMIVNSSVLLPGAVGIAQISVTVPGFHISGSALPVLLRIGGVSSSVTGPNAPHVAVN